MWRGREREVAGGDVRALQEAGIRVSLFIDPECAQMEAAARTGAEMVELHTGCFANATRTGGRTERSGAWFGGPRAAHAAGIQVNAGHGINYRQHVRRLFEVPHLVELNIGHTLVSRAMRVGLNRRCGR